MKIYTEKDLHNALAKLKEDGVEVTIYESGRGDQSIAIQTKCHKILLGANDLGVWLENSTAA